MSKKVNFIEAVNSGKRFRGEYDPNCWYLGLIDFNNIWRESRVEQILKEINAGFELEEKKITITESEFDAALERASIGEGGLGVTFNDLKKELGF